MPHFIKTGFWEKAEKGFKGWLNLDQLIQNASGLSWGNITGSISNQTDLQNALDEKQDALGFTAENVVNKATDFVAPDNTKYPTTQAVRTFVVGLQDLYIGAGAMWPRTTSGSSALTKTEIATSLLNIQSLDFDQTTQEFAQFTLSLPRNWNNGTVTAKLYWTAAAGTGTVEWGISGVAYSNDDPLTGAFGTAQTVTDTLIAVNDLHITDVTSAITLAGTPASADFLAFQISRNPASDTLNADAKLLGVIITLTTSNAVAA